MASEKAYLQITFLTFLQTSLEGIIKLFKMYFNFRSISIKENFNYTNFIHRQKERVGT